MSESRPRDEFDAVRAGREALSREYPAAPRTRGDREAWNSTSYQTVQSTEKRSVSRSDPATLSKMSYESARITYYIS